MAQPARLSRICEIFDVSQPYTHPRPDTGKALLFECPLASYSEGDNEQLKSSIFRNIALCSSLIANRLFGETCFSHLQCERISQARNLHEAGSKQNLKSYMAMNLRVPKNTENFVDSCVALSFSRETVHWS